LEKLINIVIMDIEVVILWIGCWCSGSLWVVLRSGVFLMCFYVCAFAFGMFWVWLEGFVNVGVTIGECFDLSSVVALSSVSGSPARFLLVWCTVGVYVVSSRIGAVNNMLLASYSSTVPVGKVEVQ
jgi:hypothetical protein